MTHNMRDSLSVNSTLVGLYLTSFFSPTCFSILLPPQPYPLIYLRFCDPSLSCLSSSKISCVHCVSLPLILHCFPPPYPPHVRGQDTPAEFLLRVTVYIHGGCDKVGCRCSYNSLPRFPLSFFLLFISYALDFNASPLYLFSLLISLPASHPVLYLYPLCESFPQAPQILSSSCQFPPTQSPSPLPSVCLHPCTLRCTQCHCSDNYLLT